MKSHLITLLRWSERYTKTDMVYLAKGGFWMILNQGGLFILAFFLIWVFANFLTPEQYGEYRFIITIAGILTLFTLPGMRTAIVRAVARDNSGVITEAIKTRLRWGFIGSLVAIVGASYYFFMGNTYLGSLFLLVALFVPIYDTHDVVYAYHNGRKDYLRYTTTSLTKRLFVVAATAFTIWNTTNVFIIIAVYLLSLTVSNIATYYYTIRQFPLSKTSDSETIPYGKQLSLMGSMQYLSSHFDKVALWYLAGPVQVAVYTIAISLPRELSAALNQVAILALPKMAARAKPELRQSLLRKMLIMGLASVPVAYCYYLAAPWLFTLFLPQYLESVYYSQLAAFFILFTPLTLLSQYFVSTMNTRALYTMQFIHPTITIGLYFILIPLYGITGAILALIAKEITSLIILLVFFWLDQTKENE